jgi:NAD(P)-dependent dehydrogenase (short-subunit alcohol dehydrogenase family)
MRSQRSGLVLTISSTAGISAAGDFMTPYAASKFGVEGFIESLTSEVASFGIRTLVVEPGFFRTELLSPQSTSTRRPPSRTTPNAPPQQPQRGRAWTVNGLATPENSPTLC